MIGNATATIIRDLPGGTDKYGDDNEPDLIYPDVRTEVPRCAVAPGASPEIAERVGDGVIVDLTLYLPGQPDVIHTDTVEIQGVHEGTYEIVTEPAVWQSPYTGWQPGTVVALKRSQEGP